MRMYHGALPSWDVFVDLGMAEVEGEFGSLGHQGASVSSVLSSPFSGNKPTHAFTWACGSAFAMRYWELALISCFGLKENQGHPRGQGCV